VAVSLVFFFFGSGRELSFSNDIDNVCGISVASDVESVQKVERLEESSHLCFWIENQ